MWHFPNYLKISYLNVILDLIFYNNLIVYQFFSNNFPEAVIQLQIVFSLNYWYSLFLCNDKHMVIFKDSGIVQVTFPIV